MLYLVLLLLLAAASLVLLTLYMVGWLLYGCVVLIVTGVEGAPVEPRHQSGCEQPVGGSSGGTL